MAEKKTPVPRPAKDVKPTGERAKFLQEAKQRKTKALAEDMRRKAKAQAADKKVRPAKDIKKGDSRSEFLKKAKSGEVKAAPKPDSGTNILRSTAGIAARSGLRWAGPVGALVSMTRPAGEGSDKPSGPLMKGGKLPGYKYVDEKTDRLVSPAKVYAPKGGGGPERRQGSESPSLKREAPKATEFKKKNFDANKKAGKKPDKAPAKAAPKAAEPKKPGFKGNWVGAAPTEMQKRGGAKIKRKSFADLFKKD